MTGAYNLIEPEPAAELGEGRARNLPATDADAMASANPGCSLQFAAHGERLGRRLRVVHPMELLRIAIEGDGDDDDWR